MPINKPKAKPKTKIKVVASKGELESLKIVRSFGIKDLEKYQEKIKKNIVVFEEAINKEKTEMKRVEGMIKVLKDDIRQAKRLQKFAK